jgi:post-segregation antitoxin (ccd killing protein)
MSESGLNLNHSSKNEPTTRVKVKAWKKTVGITLPHNLIEKAKKHGLNISRITEEALNSILTYIETQNTEITSETSSLFLSRGSFQKESRVPRAGFELETRGEFSRKFPLF